MYARAMRRRTKVAATALGALLAVAGAGSAPAEQASQPEAVVAGWIDAGRYHSCAIVPVASVRCWAMAATARWATGTRP